MRWRRRACVAALLAPAGLAAAEPAVVTSPGPDHVALTVYRAQNARGPIDLRFLNGFAMITETRQVQLPRGAATLRFEGVAEGIVPVSAVIDGLPGGVVEKNRDARLLSPASLIDGTLGREVMLTRTDRATGKAVSEPATLIAGPVPGVVLRTASGIETLRCSGLAEGLAFGHVPADLSRKPVLSVATVSPAARSVTVTLTYLASGFDWRASYVATLAPDGGTLDLFAWLTLANGNAEAFPDAQVQAVAGRLNRVATPALRAAAGALRLSCYPLGTTTSDLREKKPEIVVTATRALARKAAIYMGAPTMPSPAPPPPPPPPEDLGDLKLYRVPEPVLVRARGQKQVALLARQAVPFERRYRRPVGAGQVMAPTPSGIVLVLHNRKDAGLGLALPSGSTALYAQGPAGERLLTGLGSLDDRAEGETVRLAAGVSAQVRVEQQAVGARQALIIATNANPFEARLDVPIGRPGEAIETDAGALPRTDGVATWSPILPPGGRAELRYRF